MKQHSILLGIALSLTLSACDSLDVKGMFFSSGSHTEDRVAAWLEWDEQHGPNIIENVPDDYNIYFCSDPHISDNADRVATVLDAEHNDPAGLFSVVNGDIANKGGEEPYRMLDSVMRLPKTFDHTPLKSEDTCFAIIGNHDIYFDCQEHFQHYFHTSTYTVEIHTVSGAKDLFVFLDSGNATLGARQTAWLKELLAKHEEYRHIVLATHTNLFRTSYNYSTTPAATMPEEECYALMHLMEENDVDLFVMAHFHYREEHQIGSVRYVMTDNLNEQNEQPSYLVVSCGNDINYKFHYLPL